MRFPGTQKNFNEHVFSQAQLLVEERKSVQVRSRQRDFSLCERGMLESMVTGRYSNLSATVINPFTASHESGLRSW